MKSMIHRQKRVRRDTHKKGHLATWPEQTRANPTIHIPMQTVVSLFILIVLLGCTKFIRNTKNTSYPAPATLVPTAQLAQAQPDPAPSETEGPSTNVMRAGYSGVVEIIHTGQTIASNVSASKANPSSDTDDSPAMITKLTPLTAISEILMLPMPMQLSNVDSHHIYQSDKAFIGPNQLTDFVAEDMVQINRSVIELDGTPSAIDYAVLDANVDLLYLSFANKSYVAFIPVDNTEQIHPNGAIIIFKRAQNSYRVAFSMSAYDIHDVSNSVIVTGEAIDPDKKDTHSLTLTYNRAILGAGDTQLTVIEREAHLTGLLGTRTYVQLQELLKQHPEVDTLVLTEIFGSVNDTLMLHAGRLVRNAGLTTKVLADSTVASSGVALFAAGVERIYTEGAAMQVRSWCCLGDQTVGDFIQTDPIRSGQYIYFSDMLGPDVGPDFYVHAIAKSSLGEVHTLSTDEIQTFRVATGVVDSE